MSARSASDGGGFDFESCGVSRVNASTTSVVTDSQTSIWVLIASHANPTAHTRTTGRYGEVMADSGRPDPRLEHVRWSRRPQLFAPVMLVGFAGWSDAGDAASSTVEYFSEQWQARPFASIDPEIFYDFTSTRPLVQFDSRGEREIVWPEIEFASATIPGINLDVILLVAPEPQLRWQTFCDQVIGVARVFGTQRMITFGALLAEVPHTRPVSIFGVGHDDETASGLGLLPSRYEGPTGITGVLQTASREAGLPAASLWAAVPTYVPAAPSPKATLALVERAARLLQTPVELGELRQAARDYEIEVSALVDDDDETNDYVRQLEQRYDAEEPALFNDGPALVEEVERFLRDQD
jgi:proteasome assembly chaperone (PAC2) family protein